MITLAYWSTKGLRALNNTEDSLPVFEPLLET